MNRRFFLSGSAVAAISIASRPAVALLGVDCPQCSTLVTQLQELKQQALSYTTQLQQLATEVRSYAAQVQNLLVLPQTVFLQAMAMTSQARNLINGASLLTGQSGSLMTRLSSIGSYANALTMTPSQVQGMIGSWSTIYGNASTILGKTLATQNAQMTLAAANIDRADIQLQASAGMQQSMQADGELLSNVATTMNAQQGTMTAWAQEAAAYNATQLEREQLSDDAWQQFINGAEPSTTGGPVMQFK